MPAGAVCMRKVERGGFGEALPQKVPCLVGLLCSDPVEDPRGVDPVRLGLRKRRRSPTEAKTGAVILGALKECTRLIMADPGHPKTHPKDPWNL